MQLAGVKAVLPQSQNILIALPAQTTVDKLAAALALMLGFKAAGRQVTVVTEDTLRVSHTNLYGVGEIKNQLPQITSGNLTLTLENVVIPSGPDAGTVPALDKLDWYPEGSNLNLVFHVTPGQTFKPTNIIPKYDVSGFNLIFTIGAINLDSLGNLYRQNMPLFSSVHVVNVDASSENIPYGQTNILDTDTATLCEMIVQMFPSLGLTMDQDMASNILVGIYDATQNLTLGAKPDTFAAIGMAMQVGGSLPSQPVTVPPVGSQPVQPAVMPISPAPVPTVGFSSPFIQPTATNINMGNMTPPQVQPQPTMAPTANNPFMNLVAPSGVNIPVTPQPSINTQEAMVETAKVENPMPEFAGTVPTENSSPAPDWLTPKIYKGGSLG